MSVLVLRLAGPLQSWGTSSRYARREAGRVPSKSGIIGLIAAAQGRRRSDPVEDLVQLRLGVRADQPGRLVRDYQTARHPSWPDAKLSTRYYLGDAVFVAGIEADRALLEGIDEAVRSPAFPLYLGRRACPPSGRVSLGIREHGLEESLASEPWHASEWTQRRQALAQIPVEVTIDSDGGELVRDLPLSFSQERREYSWRRVESYFVSVANPLRAHDNTAASPYGDLDGWSAVGAD